MSHPITVIGLGPGDPGYVTLGARAVLDAAPAIWVRTRQHPALAALPAGRAVHSCDDLYEHHASFEAVYQAIAARLLEAARHGPVVYAVPGDPTVGETSVQVLRRMAAEAGCPVELLPGVSFVGPTLALLGWDALDGLQLADATALARRHHPDLDPDRPALVAQVYSWLVAADLKLTLLNQYPPEHPVTLVMGAGTAAPRTTTLPLHELDHRAELDDLTSLAIPALPSPGSVLSLAEVVAHLRAPDGCPWDREQTHESLRPYVLEETYEVLDALDREDGQALGEELGDLLLQIVLHAQLAVEAGEFALTDVVRGITEKIVRRHPHVFGDVRADTVAEVRANWDALKQAERADRGQADPSPFAGIPRALPALARAQEVQRRAEHQGGAPAVTAAAALSALTVEADPPADRARAVGDGLWAIASLARAWGVDAETALREAINRFEASVLESAR
jgi:tetrapyrrole methylase family protein/MazG family protein